MTQLHLAGIPEIANPTSWGNWKYNTKHQTLVGELGLDFPNRFIKLHNRFMNSGNSFMKELFRIVDGALRLEVGER